jgi:hypothetical protein
MGLSDPLENAPNLFVSSLEGISEIEASIKSQIPLNVHKHSAKIREAKLKTKKIQEILTSFRKFKNISKGLTSIKE